MDYKLEVFRNRLRTEAPKKVHLPGTVAIIISTFSLMISALTAFFNFVRQTDDLRGVLEGSVSVTGEHGLGALVDQLDQRLYVFWDHRLTLINSGNRAAALTDAAFIIGFNIDQKEVRFCNYGKHQKFSFYNFSPIVLKPGEVASVQLRLSQGSDERNIASWKAVEYRHPGREFYALACISVSVVTPDTLLKEVLIPVDRLRFEDYSIYLEMPIDDKTPVVLARKYGTILW